MPVERIAPLLIEHPVFTPPPETAPLWRYMDLARFIALLERRALFFSSIRAFPDRFEGSLTPALLAELQAEKNPRMLRDWRNWPQATYVNCWNEGCQESVALWSMYASASGGVAIRSSLGAIRASLAHDSSGGDLPDELYAGRVHYVDYSVASIPHDNANWTLVHERLAYEFEHEVRLALWPQRPIDLGRKNDPFDPIGAAVDQAPAGYDVAVDPDTPSSKP